MKVIDWPKTRCVFEREDQDGRYLVTPTVLDGMEWVFEDGVRAVDKVDGSNHCVVIEEGRVTAIDNRSTRIIDSPAIMAMENKRALWALKGALNAIERGWLKTDGRHYGELLGPRINGNRHGVDDYLFVRS